MLTYSLISGLITYTASIVYNLLARRSLDSVFFIGLRFLFYTTLTTFFIQLSFALLKSYRNSEDLENKEIEVENINSDNELNFKADNGAEETKKTDNAESFVDNEYENDDFSAFNLEEID
jgi:hypothetical protein